MTPNVMKPLLAGLVLLLVALPTQAHELRPAYLELRQTSAEEFDVLWKVPARGDYTLGLYVRLPQGCRKLQEPVIYATDDALIQRWTVRCPGGLAGHTIAVDGLSAMLTEVLLRVQWTSGASQAERLDSARSACVVVRAPTRYQLARTYGRMGIEHILLGVDHLLFVVGLLLIVSGAGNLLKTITAFTVAHSLTLTLAVLGVVHVPSRPVEAAIALSVVFLGAEILRVQRGHASLTAHQPWIVAFAFGLLHGLGFAGALTSLGLPASQIPLALLFFNAGVEVGQLLFVVALLLLAWPMRALRMGWPKWTTPVPAYGLGTLAMYWFLGQVQMMF